MSNREDIKEALKDAAQTGNRLYSDTLHLLQEDEREIERLVQDCTRIEEYLVKHKQENESLKGLAYINGKVDPRNTWLVLAEDYARQVGELKEENESLKALAYGDGDTHFSWRELAGQYKAQLEEGEISSVPVKECEECITIEALQKELVQVRIDGDRRLEHTLDEVDAWRKESVRLEQERDKLRGALEEIASKCGYVTVDELQELARYHLKMIPILTRQEKEQEE